MQLQEAYGGGGGLGWNGMGMMVGGCIALCEGGSERVQLGWELRGRQP